MRNISAVHLPIPRTVESRATTSASSSALNPRESSTTDPSSTLVARSCKDAVLLADKPTERNVLVGNNSSRSGVTPPSSAAIKRPWMAAAAAPASCWWRTDWTRAAKLSKTGRRTRGGPVSASKRRRTGSRSDNMEAAAG